MSFLPPCSHGWGARTGKTVSSSRSAAPEPRCFRPASRCDVAAQPQQPRDHNLRKRSFSMATAGPAQAGSSSRDSSCCSSEPGAGFASSICPGGPSMHFLLFCLTSVHNLFLIPHSAPPWLTWAVEPRPTPRAELGYVLLAGEPSRCAHPVPSAGAAVCSSGESRLVGRGDSGSPGQPGTHHPPWTTGQLLHGLPGASAFPWAAQ